MHFSMPSQICLDPSVPDKCIPRTIGVAADVLRCANPSNHCGVIAREGELYNPNRNLIRMTKCCNYASPEVYPVLRCSVVNNAHPIRRIDEPFICVQIRGSFCCALCSESTIIRGFYFFSYARSIFGGQEQRNGQECTE